MPKRQSRHDPVPLLEWVAAALGALVALALIGVIGWSALNEHPDELPRLSVAAGPVEAAGTVRFTVRNLAGRTAKQVQVEGTLGEQVASATLDYVPGRSEESGALLFDADPRGGAVEIKVTGYQLP